jgi:hypothetical protein
LARLFDAYAFLAATLPGKEDDLGFGDAKGLGEEGQQVAIGGTINRGCCNAHLESFAVEAGNFVATGAGLDV